jgi:hypothetical protein
MLFLIMLSVAYAVCHIQALYAECNYAECDYAECRYSECRYAECHYAECHGASLIAVQLEGPHKKFLKNLIISCLGNLFLIYFNFNSTSMARMFIKIWMQ